MQSKELHDLFFSQKAADSVGYSTIVFRDGTSVRFTRDYSEKHVDEYEWDDKVLVGIYPPEKFNGATYYSSDKKRELEEEVQKNLQRPYYYDYAKRYSRIPF